MAAGTRSHRRWSHSDATLHTSVAILHTSYTGRRQNDFIKRLRPGASQTHEWAVYPSSDCTDFFCFVNALRSDYGTDTMELGRHTGVLSAMEHGSDAQYSDMSEWGRGSPGR